MINPKSIRERTIENHLRYFKIYQTAIKNCEQQLEYILPTLTTRFGIDDNGSYFYIPNNTANVAIDRIESKRALDLREKIEEYQVITTSIKNALDDLEERERNFVEWRYFQNLSIEEVKQRLGYSEHKSVFRLRRHIIDKLTISLTSLLILK
jgi:hypothetical protein